MKSPARNPSDGKITYTPSSDYVGADSFTYLGFDSNGQSTNPATINITVNNVAPTIDSIVIPTTIREGQNIPLTATAKDGGSSANLTYTWNFGDGSNPIIGQNTTHTYADNGNYNVTLSVTDKDGGTTTTTTTIKEGEAVEFRATATDPGTKDTLSYSWNFGDNTNPVSGQNVTHTFADNGNYNVTLTVTDKD